MSRSLARRTGWAVGTLRGLQLKKENEQQIRRNRLEEEANAENQRRYNQNNERMLNLEKVNNQRYSDEQARKRSAEALVRKDIDFRRALDEKRLAQDEKRDSENRRRYDVSQERLKLMDSDVLKKNQEIEARNKKISDDKDYEVKVSKIAESLFSDPARVEKYEKEGVRHLTGIDANMDGQVTQNEIDAFNSKGKVKIVSAGLDNEGTLRFKYADGGEGAYSKPERDAINSGFRRLDEARNEQRKAADKQTYDTWREEMKAAPNPMSFDDWKNERENPEAAMANLENSYNELIANDPREALKAEEARGRRGMIFDTPRYKQLQKEVANLSFADAQNIDNEKADLANRINSVRSRVSLRPQQAAPQVAASAPAAQPPVAQPPPPGPVAASAPAAAPLPPVPSSPGLAPVGTEIASSPAADPAQQSASIPPGTVDNGFRFKGGDPRDRNNWEKADAAPSGTDSSGANRPSFNAKGYVDNLRREAAWIDRVQPQTTADTFRRESGFKASAADRFEPSQPQTLADRFRTESAGEMPPDVLVGHDGSWFYPSTGADGKQSWTSKSGVTVSADELRHIDAKIRQAQARLSRETDPEKKARWEEYIDFALALKPQIEKMDKSTAAK